MCVHFVADSRMHFMQLPFIWKKMSWKVLIRKCNMLFSYTGKTQSLSLFLFHNSLWMWIPWNLYNWCKYNVQSSSDIFYVLIWILSGKPDRWLLIPNLCSNTSTHLLLNLWLQILHHSGKKKKTHFQNYRIPQLPSRPWMQVCNTFVCWRRKELQAMMGEDTC